MEHMNSLEAGFWQLEDGQVALHIGSVGVFAGPVPEFEAIRQRYADLVERIPRYRQRMRTVPLDLDRPVWVDDTDFELADHVLRTAVPAPGGEPELLSLVGRIMSARLDPERPLWQAWVVDDIAEDRWAIVWKVHHSVVDGMGGMELMTGLLDPTSGATRSEHLEPGPVATRQSHSAGRLLLGAAAESVRAGSRAVRGALRAGTRPRAATRELITGAHGALDYAGAVTHPVTATSLTGPLGSARRYRVASVELAEVKKVRAVLGGSVNDVALTMISRGFRDLLLSRHEAVGPRVVRSLVPVSVRSDVDQPAVTNKVSALLLDLPVDYAGAGAAYGAIQARMRTLKASGESTGVVLATALAGWLPAPAVSAVVRAARHLPQHVLTTVTTNVPGPRSRMYLLGQELLNLYPYVPIAEQIRIGVAVTSYNGHLNFGVTCDRDSVPDVDVLTAALSAGLRDLLTYADETQGVKA